MDLPNPGLGDSIFNLSYKGIIYRIYKELLQVNKKKSVNTHFQMGEVFEKLDQKRLYSKYHQVYEKVPIIITYQGNAN